MRGPDPARPGSQIVICFVVFDKFLESQENVKAYNRTHARTRALPKREVSGAATGANSLFKTEYLDFSFNVERNLKNEIPYLNSHARCQKERSRERPPERIPYLKPTI